MKAKLKWEQVMEEHYTMQSDDCEQEQFVKSNHIYELKDKQ